jgi:hypothetical protein
MLPLSDELIAEANTREIAALEDDYGALGRKLARSGIDIDAVKRRTAAFSVAVPSWGAGRGGTRFAKFPIAGEPTDIHEKLEDCAVINQLCRITPRVSPHFPWDKVSDYAGLREEAETSAWASMRSIPTPSRTSPGRRIPMPPGRCPQPMHRCGTKRLSTTSNASRSANSWVRGILPCGSATAPTSPASRT